MECGPNVEDPFAPKNNLGSSALNLQAFTALPETACRSDGLIAVGPRHDVVELSTIARGACEAASAHFMSLPLTITCFKTAATFRLDKRSIASPHVWSSSFDRAASLLSEDDARGSKLGLALLFLGFRRRVSNCFGLMRGSFRTAAEFRVASLCLLLEV